MRRTCEHQMELLDFVAATFYEERGAFKLLIIDAIVALFRDDFPGPGQLAEWQQKLAQMLSRLKKISECLNRHCVSFIGVWVLSLRRLDFNLHSLVSFKVNADASTTRLSLRKGRAEMRIAKIFKSPDMPQNETTFAITAGGIVDAKE
ncbi:meiotic recombination protein DMC1/LIM15 homolog [Hippocampus comes]|uniref:meiotic recombination protein DMC1/LIM15 homolog n=1 Tax=Hippocampus comes TaxID=109280 RepID=UPI00094E6EBB|nr:PREDICTED: meiotic recombination protein DMC1/LIM15 homolog [Hippocampus comes]